jgi:hypothetical protein
MKIRISLFPLFCVLVFFHASTLLSQTTTPDTLCHTPDSLTIRTLGFGCSTLLHDSILNQAATYQLLNTVPSLVSPLRSFRSRTGGGQALLWFSFAVVVTGMGLIIFDEDQAPIGIPLMAAGGAGMGAGLGFVINSFDRFRVVVHLYNQSLCTHR